jgi:hypothetical protein
MEVIMIEKNCHIKDCPILSKFKVIIIFAVFLLIITVLICFPSSSSAISREYRNPEDVVAWLYRDFSWEVTMGDQYWQNGTLIEQPKEILSLYFSDEIVSLIIKDRACVKAKHELCSLDFDPIFVSQDPSAVDLEIISADKSNTVHVRFRYACSQERVNVYFRIEKTARGWRVSNITYGNGKSLLNILTGGK